MDIQVLEGYWTLVLRSQTLAPQAQTLAQVGRQTPLSKLTCKHWNHSSICFTDLCRLNFGFLLLRASGFHLGVLIIESGFRGLSWNTTPVCSGTYIGVMGPSTPSLSFGMSSTTTSKIMSLPCVVLMCCWCSSCCMCEYGCLYLFPILKLVCEAMGCPGSTQQKRNP